MTSSVERILRILRLSGPATFTELVMLYKNMGLDPTLLVQELEIAVEAAKIEKHYGQEVFFCVPGFEDDHASYLVEKYGVPSSVHPETGDEPYICDGPDAPLTVEALIAKLNRLKKKASNQEDLPFERKQFDN